MYKYLTIITIIIFLFLILIFYPDTLPLENISNIIYISNKKTVDIRKSLKIISVDEYNDSSNEILNEQQVSNNNYLWPLDYGVGQISSVLGYRGNSLHKGWDISTLGISQLLYSISDGIVIRTGISGSLSSGFGYICCIQYEDDKLGDFMVIYPHMKEQTKLKLGQKVNKGDVVGYTGNTGSSTGIHYHFQIGPPNDYTTYFNPLRVLYNMNMTKSDIESHFGLTFQNGAIGTEDDQKYNIKHNIDTLLKNGWEQ